MLSQMQFSGTWRDYQARVLGELGEHFEDGQIHVVAAPGSGKTVLGLEIVKRMQRPALILAPTTTIRDQWLARLVPLFLPAPPEAQQVSRQLDAPAQFTTTTYQALHAVWANDRPETGPAPRFAALVAALKARGPVTLVLDEAHHLRREWWNALLALNDALPDARLVSLTATPPYDAPLANGRAMRRCAGRSIWRSAYPNWCATAICARIRITWCSPRPKPTRCRCSKRAAARLARC